ncbi:phosphatidylglycerophosphatase A [Vreelandella aquamarina]
METLWYWLATGLGTGLSPLAPGTVGSLLGVPLAWWLLGRSRPVAWLIVVSLILLAVPLCQVVSTQLGGSDHGSIVADEIVAFPLVVLGLSAARSPWVMALAFVIYRFFDALKPPPVHLAELVSGGFGIVLDDAIAAGLSFIVLALIVKYMPILTRRSF